MTDATLGNEVAARCLILAAGYGTRLAPITDHVPKPLLPVGGVPLLDRIIERLVAAGVSRVAINSHHLGALVGAHVANHQRSDMLVHFPEPEILGTGGALDNARGFLAETEDFLVYNGDVLCDVDLPALVADHRRNGALATLLLVDWPAVNSVVLGVDGAVRHIGGAGASVVPAEGDRGLTYAGIGIFDRTLLKDIGPGFSSLIDPLVRALTQTPGAVRGYAPAGVQWDDLGTLGRWLGAEPTAGADVQTASGFHLSRITGHGSDRRFWRLGHGDWSAVAMVSPPSDDEFVRFLDIGRFLASRDLGPAEFLTVDEPALAVLMEDLGTNSLHALATGGETSPAWLQSRYQLVIEQLVALQRATPQAQVDCALAVDRRLAREQLLWETGYFREHFLRGHLGLQAEDLQCLDDEFATLAAVVADSPVVLLHRDFQSQNILFQNDRVRLVDFQGLRLGPLAYDLASLVWDPYVDIPGQMRQDLVTHFARESAAETPDRIRAMTVTAGLQRVMQALGAYGFLGHVKGKTDFLAHIPAGVCHLNLLLQELMVWQVRPGAELADCLPPPMTNLTRLVDGIIVQSDRRA